jgi:hypothetical protein
MRKKKNQELPTATNDNPPVLLEEKKKYFTSEHEAIIIKYSTAKSPQEKDRLYRIIKPVFDEMVDKIVFTYKFNNLPNYEHLKDECKFFLTTILEKYDPTKGYKAFSYFSVITKNWFIYQVKRNKKSLGQMISFEDSTSILEDELIIDGETYMKEREQEEFWIQLSKTIATWDITDFKPHEKQVLEAIKIIIEKKDNIEIFNKKGIHIYIRDITGLPQKQISQGLLKIRKKYSIFKREYDNGKETR